MAVFCDILAQMTDFSLQQQSNQVCYYANNKGVNENETCL